MRRLHFGCGANRIEGWENYDKEEVDLDVIPLIHRTYDADFGDNSADMIFTEHVCEHFTASHVLRLLDEFYRILKPNGKLRVCMPVLNRLDDDHARDIILGHGHQSAWDSQMIALFLNLAHFQNIIAVGRDEAIDGHYRMIGREKDFKETARYEATK